MLALDRDYGDLSYDDVVKKIRNDEIRITPGHRLPQLFDAQTNLKIKGTGTPVITQGVTPHQKIAAEFRAMAVDDIEMVYSKIVDQIKHTNDPRWAKIFLEFTIGKVDSARGSDGMADAINKLIDMIDSKPQIRTVVIDQND